jgi:hypothetical protein
MRLRAIAFAAPLVLASAGLTPSFAQTTAVSEKTFDWIFFAIVGIPFVLALVYALVTEGLRPRYAEAAERRYPPTVTDAFAARPLNAWGIPEEEKVAVTPEPYRTRY